MMAVGPEIAKIFRKGDNFFLIPAVACLLLRRCRKTGLRGCAEFVKAGRIDGYWA